MKIKLLVCTLIVLLAAMPLLAAPPGGKSAPPKALSVDNTTYIDVNRILMFVTNHGNFGRDLSGVFGYDYGTFFPYAGADDILDGSNVKSPYYAGGLWIGGLDSVSGEIRIAVSEYDSEYRPGPADTINKTFFPDKGSYKVYKLYRDSLEANPNEDYLNWPVGDGAPVDSLGLPAMIGDQMCWSVYTDFDSAQHENDAGNTDPLGIEVRQTIFAFDRQGSLGNIVFLRFQIFNRGDCILKNCFLSLWSDPDLGGAGDDLVGCDTTIGLGFVYNSTDNDEQYGPSAPSLGIDFFQGPLVETGDMADTGRMWGQKFPGYTNMALYSFNKYINGTDPRGYDQTYNYMQGLDRFGAPYLYSGDTLLFVASGDPVTGAGDLDNAAADRRWMQTTGPIDFRPGDSTEILAAVIVGQGADRLSSITILRELDRFAQRVYEDGFNPPPAPAKPDVTVAQLSGEVTFSWTDTSEVDNGEYPFEGYSVWQSESRSGPWTLLATYDLQNDIDSLTDIFFDTESGLFLSQSVRALKNLGLSRYYRARTDVFSGQPLRDVQDYYFRITAFSYSDTLKDGRSVPDGDRFLESQTVLTVRPQAPILGEASIYNSYDTIPAVHVGGSDGAVYPLAVDPFALTGDSYKVDFGEDTVIEISIDTTNWYTYTELTDTCDVDWDTAGDSIAVTLCVDTILDSTTFSEPALTTTISTFWTLVRTSTDDTLLSRQFNLSGDDNYQTFDGLLIKVSGPPLEGKSYSYASASPTNFSPVAVAENSYPPADYPNGIRWFTGSGAGELLAGGVYMEPNFNGTTVPPAEAKKVQLRFRPMASYTDLNGNEKFDHGEPYVVDQPAQTQKAYMYQGWTGDTYLGCYDVPFTAWDVTDPENERQLNVVMRDRDQNHQWDLNFKPSEEDPLLPNNGDVQYNYTWICNSDYDGTGNHYGDGTGGTVDFYSGPGGSSLDPLWALWLGPRTGPDGVTPLGMLSEECRLTLTPYYVVTTADTFTFSSTLPTFSTDDAAEMDKIKVVPNPFYLYGPYDPAAGSYQMRFHHLPAVCDVKIYTLGGDLIRTLAKNDASTSTLEWNVQTEEGLPVASGIYIWVVDAPGFGTKVGKMAIFTETEVLDLY